MCLKFIDTEQEKKIEVGISWPFEKLSRSECIISSAFEKKGIKVGDQVVITLQQSRFWTNIGRNEYNAAAVENDWPLFNSTILDMSDNENGSNIAVTTIPCTVKAMISETYGKMPEESSKA